VRAAPGEKTNLSVIESTVQDCAVVACLKRALDGLPSPARPETLAFELKLDPGAPPGSAKSPGGNSPKPLLCADPRRPDDEVAPAEGTLPPERIQAIAGS
jgi:hypothetical protein